MKKRKLLRWDGKTSFGGVLPLSMVCVHTTENKIYIGDGKTPIGKLSPATYSELVTVFRNGIANYHR